MIKNQFWGRSSLCWAWVPLQERRQGINPSNLKESRSESFGWPLYSLQLHTCRSLGTSNGESKTSLVSNVWCHCLCPSTSCVVRRNRKNPNNAVLTLKSSESYRNNGLENYFWKQFLARQCQILETGVSFQLFVRKGSCNSGEGTGNTSSGRSLLFRLASSILFQEIQLMLFSEK